jgi:RNA recognition motif-containing protein
MRIFVGNLAYTTTEDDLDQLFSPYGVVERIQIMTDRETGRARGFGFVEMPDATQAQAAIAGLNGTSLGGRQLTVNEARRREGEERPRRPGQERRERW